MNLVAFPTNIGFQVYLLIDNLEIKNKSLNKCSVGLRSYPYSFVVLRYDPRCSGCDPLLRHCSVCDPLLRCSTDLCFARCRITISSMRMSNPNENGCGWVGDKWGRIKLMIK